MGSIPPFFTFYGAASNTAPGYLTTGAQTLSGLKTWVITHTDSSAENLMTWRLDEDTVSTISIANATSTNATFHPAVLGVGASSNRPALTLLGSGTTDSGTTAVVRFIARIGSSTAVATRPAYSFTNNGTEVAQITAAGGLVVSGGTAASISVGTAKWRSGTGSPEGVVTGSVGDLWSRTDGGAGTCFYVKESGAATNTGWVAK